MDEYIELRFRKNDQRFKVRGLNQAGIEFDERDPIRRAIGVGLTHRNEVTRLRLDNIRRTLGWLPGQFDLKASVEDGSLILRGFNRHALPEGFYKVRLQVEEVQSAGGWVNLTVPHDGSAVADIDLSMDDRTVAVDLAGCDAQIAAVLGRSTIDGVPAVDWAQDQACRASRKACLLNLLATLRVRPRANDNLIDLVDRVFHVANDRIYARVDKAFLPTLRNLSQDNTKPFYEEGTPHAAIHQQMFALIEEPPEILAQFHDLRSFRAEASPGKPSMQIVVAVAPASLPYTYAEFDLDLGNPLQDVLGFFVHMGELLAGKCTNHLDLRKKLQQTSAADFLYYSVVKPS
jgi:hypothetical protein